MTLPEIFATCTKMDDALIALYNTAEALEAIGMDASYLDAQQEIIQKANQPGFVPLLRPRAWLFSCSRFCALTLRRAGPPRAQSRASGWPRASRPAEIGRAHV